MGPKRYATVREAIAERKTNLPLLCVRPHIAGRRTAQFARRFPGTVAYAVKVQSDELILKAIAAAMSENPGGRVAFDVASLEEIKLTRGLFPSSELFFMHPMKKLGDIAAAYRDYGVRRFVVDTFGELDKFAPAQVGKDSTIFVRLATHDADRPSLAAYDLSSKFGAEHDLACELLKAISAAGYETGIAIHAGSQFEDAIEWQASVDAALRLRETSGIAFKYLDIGGGFPGHYRGTDEAEVDRVYGEVFERLARLKSDAFELVGEPGRALVYDSVSVVSEVVGIKPATGVGMSKDDQKAGKKIFRPTLYIDEGIWSTLSESMTANFGWPVRPYRRASGSAGKIAYYIAGVTCDSCDSLAGEYQLPENMAIGDLIEFGNIGAYGTSIGSRFNGFGNHETVVVDEPFQSA